MAMSVIYNVQLAQHICWISAVTEFVLRSTLKQVHVQRCSC
eukprot:XP_001709642.1 Hypothetical protein GL50803_35272 [Giardia lamblia ATCC 50803]